MEKLPVVGEGGAMNISGFYIVGDLTEVLSFGRFGNDGSIIHDRLPASPVCMAELTVNGSTVK